MFKFVENIRRSIGLEKLVPRRLPAWIEAIGAQIALRYDVTREPLPDKMDHVLSEMEEREARDGKRQSEGRKLEPGSIDRLY
ncbi:MAG: hypothetical protein WC807_04200 [Hyphomicrobium sp.]|jgi:hypothetical protein